MGNQASAAAGAQCAPVQCCCDENDIMFTTEAVLFNDFDEYAPMADRVIEAGHEQRVYYKEAECSPMPLPTERTMDADIIDFARRHFSTAHSKTSELLPVPPPAVMPKRVCQEASEDSSEASSVGRRPSVPPLPLWRLHDNHDNFESGPLPVPYTGKTVLDSATQRSMAELEVPGEGSALSMSSCTSGLQTPWTAAAISPLGAWSPQTPALDVTLASVLPDRAALVAAERIADEMVDMPATEGLPPTHGSKHQSAALSFLAPTPAGRKKVTIAEPEASRPARTLLEMVLQAKNGGEKTVCVARQPLGVRFGRETNQDASCMRVDHVEKASYGWALGMDEGMVVKNIGGEDLTTKSYEDAQAILQNRLAALAPNTYL